MSEKVTKMKRGRRLLTLCVPHGVRWNKVEKIVAHCGDCVHLGWVQGQRGTVEFRVNMCCGIVPNRFMHITQPKYLQPDPSKPEPKVAIPGWCPLPVYPEKEEK